MDVLGDTFAEGLDRPYEDHGDPRQVLGDLAKSSALGYAGLSRLIGRNSAYIHQFVNRGIPKKLDERDRATLARHFGIDEVRLGGSENGCLSNNRTVWLPIHSANSDVEGISNGEVGGQIRRVPFDIDWLASITDCDSSELCLIQSTSDVMSPAILHEDVVLVSRNPKSLQDGIYALNLDGSVVFRRIARCPGGSELQMICDNSRYPVWEDINPSSLSVIGRAVWISRSIS